MSAGGRFMNKKAGCPEAFFMKSFRTAGKLSLFCLCLFDLQDLHGTGLRANSAGDTLARVLLILSLDDQAEGTGLHALAAADTFLLIDHVNALRVLGDRFLRTGFRALSALYAGHGLRRHAVLLHFDVDAGIVLAVSLVKCLRFTGHKGLRGPQGTGGFLVRSALAERMEPLLSGGTGSASHTEEVPAFLPDRFEPGTPNLPGILGLHAALSCLETQDMEALFRHESALAEQFLVGLRDMDPGEKRLKVIGRGQPTPSDSDHATSGFGRATSGSGHAVSGSSHMTSDSGQAIPGMSGTSADAVAVSGAPSAHKTLGTYPEGTIRFSFGPDNTPEEVAAALAALGEITGC